VIIKYNKINWDLIIGEKEEYKCIIITRNSKIKESIRIIQNNWVICNISKNTSNSLIKYST